MPDITITITIIICFSPGYLDKDWVKLSAKGHRADQAPSLCLYVDNPWDSGKVYKSNKRISIDPLYLTGRKNPSVCDFKCLFLENAVRDSII